jgi:Flp pilus assembly protein TadD
LATALSKVANLDESAEHFEQLLQLDPRSAEAHASLGAVRLRQNRRAEALAEFREAVRCNPTSAQLHNDLGKVLAETGGLDTAADEFSEALRLAPGLTEAWYCLGITRARQNRLADAADALAHAVEREPASQPYRQSLAAALQALAKSGEADRAREIAKRLPPEFRSNLAP